ncbi:hypothetical protein FP2506_13519 [Fulvimarina pelagi HTCC2506]|uniref:Uncharacterized protein n=1 Tax=Fulvimarina pelagi HTCC2506 TaxID=314231 RepID=Q0G4M6_9HYPH|nr:hypothetical protein [Fulvimarina pelagi]EAU41455.1 hypothetical protein FP2506_13519 [Fulvimarina pelagi HTCC2506]
MKTLIAAITFASLSAFASTALAGGLVPGSESGQRAMEEMTRSEIARGR